MSAVLKSPRFQNMYNKKKIYLKVNKLKITWTNIHLSIMSPMLTMNALEIQI